MTHAECSPSQLSRLIACPGSRRLLRQASKDSTSYAEEGTLLHRAMEIQLKYNDAPAVVTLDEYARFKTIDYWNNEYKKLNLNREQRIAIEECLDYFHSLMRELALTSEEEPKVALEAETSLAWCGMPEIAGHADVVIVTPGRCDIIDWKFGAGIKVDCENNPQARAYAAGVFTSSAELEQTQVYTHIVQPRMDNMGYEQLSGRQLYQWLITFLKPAIQKTREPKAPCVPGVNQCRWCVGVTCKAYSDEVKHLATEIFTPYVEDKVPPQDIPVDDFVGVEKLTYLLDKAKFVKAFISDLSAYMLKQCMTPEGLPGYKVVAGRSSRKWVDQEHAETVLSSLAENAPDDFDFDFEDLYETKFVTVAKAEKLSKQLKQSELFKELWQKFPGKPTLAKASDPRPPVLNTATATFSAYKAQQEK